MVGTDYDGKTIRLRSFKGVREEDAAWWEHDPNDYEYGDIFISNGIEPEVREEGSSHGTVRERYFGSDAKLEKIGNCKTLMTLKILEIEDVDYDGGGHWSVHLLDTEQEKEYGYYYGFSANAIFGVNLTGCEEGDLCIFAFVGDIPIEVVEKVG